MSDFFSGLDNVINNISSDLSSFIKTAGYIHTGNTTIVSNPAFAGLTQESTPNIGYVAPAENSYNNGVIGVENTLTQLISSPIFIIFILIVIVIMILKK